MIPSRIIEAKRDGRPLEPEEIGTFFEGYLRGTVPDYQVSALLMAIVWRGLNARETGVLVDTMVESGAELDFSDWGRPVADKHSTGGVGDKVSIALAPLAAELGVLVPMMSGRGLGHTTGTLDKLEAIPGFRVDLDLDAFRRVLDRVGCAMIGQTSEIAPLDRKLYALRDVTGTVPSVPLIAASIMSKKLAEGLDALVLDVKVGAGAFLARADQARELASTMVRIGEQRGLSTVAVLSAMDRPLGVAVGNGLETAEAIECLRGEGPPDLRTLVVRLAAEMAVASGLAGDAALWRERAEEALDSGVALERLRALVEAQGGDPSVLDGPTRLHTAAERSDVRATEKGTVRRVHPRVLGDAVIALGGGRTRMEDAIDPGVGFEIYVEPGDGVHPGDVLGRVHAATPEGVQVGARAILRSVEIGDASDSEAPLPLILERVGPVPEERARPAE